MSARKKIISRSIFTDVPSPKQVMDYLNDHVIGQYEAKKRLSVAVYNHYRRLDSYMNAPAVGDPFSDVVIEKSNVLLLGGTGTGKTYLIKTIANMLGVPYYIQDCTKLTASGYVGDDVENCITGLLKACDYNVPMAELGIVCLDEVDKLAAKNASVNVTRDVSGECVQQGLLKIVEGSRVGVMPQGGRKHPEQPLVEVDTSNILFIAMGAFDGLDHIVSSRITSADKQIGFNRSSSSDADSPSSNPLRQVTSQDLRRFGLIPEFIGRFPVVTYTNPLLRDDLRHIVTDPKNSILRQYQKLFHLDGKELVLEDAAIDVIVDHAIRSHTGARGIRSIFETVLNDVMFDHVGSRKRRVLVSADYAAQTLSVHDPSYTVAPTGAV